MANRMMRWFTWAHLPDHLQPISRLCGHLAMEMDDRLPEGAEKTAGLRKLLESKDCFVRAKLEDADPICTESGLLKDICQHCETAEVAPVSASDGETLWVVDKDDPDRAVAYNVSTNARDASRDIPLGSNFPSGCRHIPGECAHTLDEVRKGV